MKWRLNACLFKNVKFVKKKYTDKIFSKYAQPNLESAKEFLKIHYFLYVLNHAIDSLIRKFEQYITDEDILGGFLFSIEMLR